MDDDTSLSDPILILIGSELVHRFKSGELGVFGLIEVQNSILDKLSKTNPRTMPLLQIFEDSKIPKVRAHKLERLIKERLTTNVPPVRQPSPPTSPISMKPNSPPVQTMEPVKTPLEVVPKQGIFRLHDEDAKVRIRTLPDVENGQVLAIIDSSISILVKGVFEAWFLIQWGEDSAWVLAELPNGQGLFHEETRNNFEARIEKVERELEELKAKLRAI